MAYIYAFVLFSKVLIGCLRGEMPMQLGYESIDLDSQFDVANLFPLKTIFQVKNGVKGGNNKIRFLIELFQHEVNEVRE